MIRKFNTAYLLFLLFGEEASDFNVPYRFFANTNQKNADQYIGFFKHLRNKLSDEKIEVQVHDETPINIKTQLNDERDEDRLDDETHI